MVNLADPADFMRRQQAAKDTKPAIAKPAAKPEATEPEEKPEGDAPMTIAITKKPEGGYHRSIDAGDGFPADESDHESLSDAAKLGEALEAKFGESAVEDAEEAIAPGIHEKVEEKLEGEGDSASKPALPKGGFLGKFGKGQQ